MTVWNLCLAAAVLLAAPFALGVAAAGMTGEKKITAARCYLLGMFMSYAVFQIVSVPFILLKTSFTLLCIVVSVVYVALILFGIIRFRCRIERPFRGAKGVWDVLFICCAFTAFAFAIYLIIRYTHTDDDDARFVVNAVDILKNDTMFLTNPGTGAALAKWEGELCRDVTSPWAAYQAYLAKLTLMHPTVMIHTVQPLALYLSLFAVQWEISAHFAGESVRYRGLFCSLLWIMLLYLEYNSWTAEAFLRLRIWQGKAVIAGVGIPAVLLYLFDLYEKEDRPELLQLLIVNTGMCLMSNMGILFGTALTGAFGVVYGIVKKDWKFSVRVLLTALPGVLYAGMSLLIG